VAGRYGNGTSTHKALRARRPAVGLPGFRLEVLTSRILLRQADLDRSGRFYRDVLGLAVYREVGLRTIPPSCSSLGQARPGLGDDLAAGPGCPRVDARDIWTSQDLASQAHPTSSGRENLLPFAAYPD
jgi:catechol 2,3-dioxygenase-like lactoylglutathione lyase family enzyme